MYGKNICQLTELTGCLENQAQKMKTQGCLYKNKMIQVFSTAGEPNPLVPDASIAVHLIASFLHLHDPLRILIP